MPGVPEAASTAAYIVLGLGLVFYGALAVRAARTYLLTRRLADLAVVYGLVLLGVALAPGPADGVRRARLVARPRLGS